MKPSIVMTPLRSRESVDGAMFERLLPADVGIDMVHPIDTSHPLKRLYDSGFAAGGVAIGDVDGDQLPDLFFSSGPRKNRLYLQEKTDDDSLRFKDATDSAGVDGSEAWSSGAVMVDIDGDGDLDLYVCNYDTANHLFVNDGQGRFEEKAAEHGLAIRDASMFPAFADYDNDGDLDCYLLTHRFYREGGMPDESPVMAGPPGGARVKPAYERYYRLVRQTRSGATVRTYGREDYLLRNDGSGRFEDVTRQAGIEGDGLGLSATWCDMNRDGWIDLYVANDWDEPDRLYANKGDGTFQEVSAGTVPHTTWFSMGSDAADLNNDGHLDLFVVDMMPDTHYMQKTTMGAMNVARLNRVAGPPPQLMRNALFINSGTSWFREAAYLAGLADSGWSWAPKLGDFDCDGRVDIYISNGVVRNFTDSDLAIPVGEGKGKTYWDFFEGEATRPEQNLAYRNLGDLRFEDTSRAWGLDHVGMSYASAYGDLDQDGDLDLVTVNLDEEVRVYRNRSAEQHRVAIRLVGRGANTYGLGALVFLRTENGLQVRQLNPNTGFLSGNAPIVHFGLGQAERIERLDVIWPGRMLQVFLDLPVDHLFTIHQAKTSEDVSLKLKEDSAERYGEPPMYRSVPVAEDVVHDENVYDDFSRQPLLPKRLSQLGPGMALGDIDGDGLAELFRGGAAGQAGQLFRLKDDRYLPIQIPCLENDRASEDMGAVFLDVEGDGDLDLYVVSGGYEFEEGSDLLRDRLYLNTGEGEWIPASRAALPASTGSGGVVCAADFDRDGDLDLFIGGRVIPGRYPLAPENLLLRNETTDGHPRFVNAMAGQDPGLLKSGLVTAALWSDANGDGWTDLLVAHEWGPLRLFQNEAGRLVEVTREAGLEDSTGWWNGITGRDLDGDGDIDYVVSNCGLNTRYHASEEKPARIYYGDFDGSGSHRIVEAEYEGLDLYPVRGKSCSTRAMPYLKERFETYHDFAKADLKEIYRGPKLEDAESFVATTLEHSVFINDGSGRFQRRALPRGTQIAPGFGVRLTEVDGDGHPDLYMVQNFHSPQPEVGPMHGGVSQLLLGSKSGELVPVAPERSGLLVPGDGMSLVEADMNSDSHPDYLVGLNDNAAQAFEHRARTSHRIVRIRLSGRKGNASGVGSKVTLVLDNGATQSGEVYAGDGYLSQSPPALSFGVPEGKKVSEVRVRWPDGSESIHENQAMRHSYLLKQPK